MMSVFYKSEDFKRRNWKKNFHGMVCELLMHFGGIYMMYVYASVWVSIFEIELKGLCLEHFKATAALSLDTAFCK
jgi:hypothetical protein